MQENIANIAINFLHEGLKFFARCLKRQKVLRFAKSKKTENLKIHYTYVARFEL